jgi:hypothetical protein
VGGGARRTYFLLAEFTRQTFPSKGSNLTKKCVWIY